MNNGYQEIRDPQGDATRLLVEIGKILETHPAIRQTDPQRPDQLRANYFIAAPLNLNGNDGVFLAVNNVGARELAQMMVYQLPEFYCTELVNSLNILMGLKTPTGN